MRKVTIDVVQAFENRTKRTVGNTHTDGKSLFLHGNEIAKWDKNGDLLITNAGWSSNTTKERLNGLPGVSIVQKNFQWYLNGMEWYGEWVRPKSYGFDQITEEEAETSDRDLKSVAFVAKLGEIFGNDEKEKNEWKRRMLVAGLEPLGLTLPEDWDALPEEENRRRLDGAINELN